MAEIQSLSPSIAARLLLSAALRADAARMLGGPGSGPHKSVLGPSALDTSKSILGVVTPQGEVRMRNPTPQFNDHTQLFGSLHHPSRRFAVDRGVVRWDETPHPDDKAAVENRLGRLGVSDVRHVELVKTLGGPGSGIRGHVTERERETAHQALDELEAKHGDEIPTSAVFANETHPGEAPPIDMHVKGALTEVPVSKLASSQSTLSTVGVTHYIIGGGRKQGVPASVVKGPTGLYHIVEGHHRLAAEVLAGRKNVTVEVHRAADGVCHAAGHPESAIHKAADAHLDRMRVAVMYAFLRGRKAYRAGVPGSKSAQDAAVEAVKDGLLKSLPPVLLDAVVAGGNVGLGHVKMRAAGGPGSGIRGHVTERLHVDVFSVGSTQTYHLSQRVSALASDDRFIWEHDLLPSLDGQRPAGISDTQNAIKVGAARALNALSVEHGVTKGFAVEITSGQRRVGLATVARSHVNDKDYPDFLKAASDYMGGNRLNASQEKTLGKWLGFSKTSTAQYLSNKQAWNQRHASLRTLDDPPFGIRFDNTNPAAVAWAQEHAAKLAKDLSSTTEQDIQDAVASALAGEGLDAAYDDILDAVGDEERADVIARTEIMDASNEGLSLSWDAAQEAGLLPEDATKVWIATSGACDDCDELDGEEVPLDEDFSIGDDPPAHPNCRCTMGIGTGGGE